MKSDMQQEGSSKNDNFFKSIESIQFAPLFTPFVNPTKSCHPVDFIVHLDNRKHLIQ